MCVFCGTAGLCVMPCTSHPTVQEPCGLGTLYVVHVQRLRLIDTCAGDKLDFIVWPKDDHDCDAALVLEAKIWDSSEFKETTTF